jgi:hypothetical protein
MPNRMVQTKVVAWWLAGEEECPHCGQLYAYEVEFRCPECDGPSCPHCRREHELGGVICVACLDDCAEGSSHG